MVIPISDHNPTRLRPWVTWTLLAANVAVFVLLQPWQAAEGCVQERFFLRWATIPAEVTTGQPLDAGELAAATSCPVEPITDKPVHLAIAFSLFLHAGWGHLLGNMLYLWIFGNNVEDRMGHVRFLAFYLAIGVVATLVFVAVNASTLHTLVGASGAIAGVLGAYLLIYPGASVTVLLPFAFFLPARLPAWLVLGSWFVLQLFSGRVAQLQGGEVAYLAHVAGFVAGALVVLLLGLRIRRPDYHSPDFRNSA